MATTKASLFSAINTYNVLIFTTVNSIKNAHVITGRADARKSATHFTLVGWQSCLLIPNDLGTDYRECRP